MKKILIIFVIVATISLAAFGKAVYLAVPPATFHFNTVINLKTVNMQEEIWKEVKDFEGYYEVSNTGRIRSVKRQVSPRQKRQGKERVIMIAKDGYAGLILYRDGSVEKKQLVHRAVAQAFVPNPENKPHVNHKNSIRHDNRAENLEWVTSSENRIHGIKFGNVKTYSHWTGKTGAAFHASKPVLQMTMENEVIKEFAAQRDAWRETGIHQVFISMCCRGLKESYGGFKWSFKHKIN